MKLYVTTVSSPVGDLVIAATGAIAIGPEIAQFMRDMGQAPEPPAPSTRTRKK